MVAASYATYIDRYREVRPLISEGTYIEAPF